MANVLVRNLPEHIHRKLAQRARAGGISLQRYLSAELTRLAETPSLEEIVARIERRSLGTVGFEQALEDLEEARGER